MKKTKIFLSALVVLSILAIIAFSGCSESDSDADSKYTVKYEITGPATTALFIQFLNETGNMITINDVNIPWEKTIIIAKDRTGHIGASCSAGFGSSNTNTYTAKIYLDGTEKSSATSSASGVVATYQIK